LGAITAGGQTFLDSDIASFCCHFAPQRDAGAQPAPFDIAVLGEFDWAIKIDQY
jgi:hypothetical protein